MQASPLDHRPEVGGAGRRRRPAVVVGAAGAEVTLPPSGRQFVIGHGSTRAVVTEVGGGLRELTVGNEAIVWSYPEEAICGGGRGQVLFPWPNRIEDGSYEFQGVRGRAALDEPEHRNAIHGLVRWLPWTVERESAAVVRLGCALAPQPGYPWRVTIELVYTVSDGQLGVGAEIVNQSATVAPVGLGIHPYLNAGAGGADGCTLFVPARQHLRCDERGLPRGIEDVAGTSWDLRDGAPLAGVHLDDCFTGLAGGLGHGAAPDAAWEVQLRAADGRRRCLWAGSGWGYVMCYTGDTLSPADRRQAVAVEPMTCPPNALRTGESVIVLAPGARWAGRYGIRTLAED